MIAKLLTLSLCVFSLASCAADWKIVKTPIEQNGESEDPATEADPNAAVAPRPRTPAPTIALKDNPFAVPEVTGKLPDEDDLKPGIPSPRLAPVNPVEDNSPQATVTAKPPVPAEEPANPDSE